LRKTRSFFRFAAMFLAVSALITAEIFVVFETLRRGFPTLIKNGFSTGFAAQIVNTALITTASLTVAMPLSVGMAVCLGRTRNNPLKKAVRRALSALSGVPSAVYGLFGYLLFGGIFSMRYSLLSGALTAALLVLPPTVFVVEAVTRSAGDGAFKGALAVGATEGKAVFSVLLPEAFSGILNAAFLASARVAAESAALILTSGIGERLPQNGIFSHFMRSGATLTVGMYQSVLKGENDLAFSAGVVLLLMLFLLDEVRKRVKKWHRK